MKAFDAYIAEYRRGGASPDSLQIAKTKSGHFLRLWSAGMPVANINNERVTKYIETREDEGAAALTIKRELDELRRMLKVAIHRGWFHTPLERVMPLKFDPEYEPRKRWMTPTELAKLCAELGPDRGAWVSYAVAAMCRLGEMRRAMKGDVDFQAETVLVRGTKRKQKKAWKKVAITSLQEPLVRFALKHTKALPDGRLFRPWASVHRDLKSACARLSTCTACRKKRLLRPAAGCAGCKAATFPYVTTNDFRRTMGHWLKHAGLDTKLIGEQLRHASDEMAQRVYATGEESLVADLIRQRVTAVPQVVPERIRKAVPRGLAGRALALKQAGKRRNGRAA